MFQPTVATDIEDEDVGAHLIVEAGKDRVHVDHASVRLWPGCMRTSTGIR
jgi:hypothetical protein